MVKNQILKLDFWVQILSLPILCSWYDLYISFVEYQMINIVSLYSIIQSYSCDMCLVKLLLIYKGKTNLCYMCLGFIVSIL